MNNVNQKILDLHEQGLSYSQIAQEVGVPKSTVGRIMLKLKQDETSQEEDLEQLGTSQNVQETSQFKRKKRLVPKETSETKAEKERLRQEIARLEQENSILYQANKEFAKNQKALVTDLASTKAQNFIQQNKPTMTTTKNPPKTTVRITEEFLQANYNSIVYQLDELNDGSVYLSELKGLVKEIDQFEKNYKIYVKQEKINLEDAEDFEAITDFRDDYLASLVEEGLRVNELEIDEDTMNKLWEFVIEEDEEESDEEEDEEDDDEEEDWEEEEEDDDDDQEEDDEDY